MRRRHLIAGLLVILCVVVCPDADAEPQLALSPVQASLGETATLALRLDNVTEPCIGFNATFSLPEGLTLAAVEPGQLLSGGFTIDSHGWVEDTAAVHAVIAYSVTDVIPGASGVLMAFAVQVSSDPDVFGLDKADLVNLELPIRASGLAAADGETSMPHTTVNGVIAITRSPGPLLVVSPAAQTLSAAAGQTSFAVLNAGQVDISWTATLVGGLTWLAITSGNSGVNDGTVVIDCQENTQGASRSAEVIVDAGVVPGSPAIVTVTQTADTEPHLSVDPVTAEVPSTFGVLDVLVQNAGAGTLSWLARVISGPDWLSITSGATGKNGGVVSLAHYPNTSASPRTGMVEITAPGASGSPAYVTVVQLGREYLSVTAPNGGEYFHRRETMAITWTSLDPAINAVSITLVKGGGLHSTIALTADNSGAHNWTIPPDIEPGDDYMIQIFDVANAAANDESDGAFAIACPPEVPGNLRATDGQPTKVVVTWNPVDAATHYEIYRNETNDPDTADLLGTSNTTQYDDTTALPPPASQQSSFSCRFNNPQYYYFYWVKAVNDCSTSEFSLSNRGHCGLDEKVVYEKVLPADKVDDEDLQAVSSGSVLCVRLRGEEEIDVAQVWGTVTWSDAVTEQVEWIPIDAKDGWVVYTPEFQWTPGEVIEMTVGGADVLGEPIGPITFMFQVIYADASAEASAKGLDPLWQPDYGDFDSDGLDLNGESNDIVQFASVNDTAPALEGVEPVGPTYHIGPEQAFAVPQRVWLPVPAGLDPSEVAAWYYYGAEQDQGWYPAESVEGWLVPDSQLVLDMNDTTYLGLLVRHGGTVQLVIQQDVEESTAASVVSPSATTALGDVLVLAGAAVIALAARRRHTSRNRARVAH